MAEKKIKIDDEFRKLIPPLRPEEMALLEESCLREGIRDALVVWAEHGILLDGHNRYDIAKKHGLAFDTTDIEMPDREAAADWIEANQLARRNLTPDQFTMLLGRRYNRTKRQGARTDLTSPQNEEKLTTAERLASEHGVSRATVERAGKVAEMLDASPKAAAAILSGEMTITEFKRERKAKEREKKRKENAKQVAAAKKPEELEGKFSTIAIDPPWDKGDEGDVDQLGRAQPTYATMSFEKLLKLPVARLADKDAHIYMWITNRSLPKGFKLLEEWGFRYITCITWCKPSFGMGNYFRGSTEHILFGVKGSLPLRRKDVGTWFQAKRGKKGHSSKPMEFYDLVESCSPGPYMEMFARSNRDGWTSWGAEA